MAKRRVMNVDLFEKVHEARRVPARALRWRGKGRVRSYGFSVVTAFVWNLTGPGL